MDFDCTLQVLATLSVVVLIYYKAWKMITFPSQTKNPKPIPEPHGSVPLLGHIHQLQHELPMCRILGAIADKHGPVFTLRFGLKRALVISSWEAVKDCFKTNDHAFLTRPLSAALKYMGYDGALFGLASYGSYWRQTRKIAISQLLSLRQLESVKRVRESELEFGIKHLYSLCNRDRSVSKIVNMTQWISSVTFNMSMRMIVGKRFNENEMESHRFIAAMKRFMYLTGVFVISDVVPFTGWLDLQGHVSAMKRNAEELDSAIDCWLEEHIQRRRSEATNQESDFLDVLISLLENEDSICGYKTRTVIKATALNLIIGAMDTTSVTLTWAISLLLNHLQVLSTATEELDKHVGKQRWVQESDFNSLPYLQAIVKETLRLYPAGPLSAPREAMEDCNVCGYNIPRGTRLIVNIWKLHRDPRVWPNPSEFQPERFLTGPTSEMNVRGQNFEYIPFSTGRRACPGLSAGMLITTLTLARVIQGFELSTHMNALVDMREGSGLSLPKVTPLEAVISPRLSHRLYKVSDDTVSLG